MVNKRNYKHGYFGTPTYKSWSEMIYRCKNNGRGYLNGRNINVCDEWKDFKNFLKDMGERPFGTSIDRIDNSKGYYKENCRWATSIQQARNKTNTKLFKGKTLSEWSAILGIKRSTLAQRYYVYSWSLDRVLSK
jgi:hypothetical protein